MLFTSRIHNTKIGRTPASRSFTLTKMKKILSMRVGHLHFGIISEVATKVQQSECNVHADGTVSPVPMWNIKLNHSQPEVVHGRARLSNFEKPSTAVISRRLQWQLSMHNLWENSKQFLFRTSCCTHSLSSLRNLPGEALHAGERSTVIQCPVRKISDVTTHTHKNKRIITTDSSPELVFTVSHSQHC